MPTVRPRTTQYLWEFLLHLLDGEQTCPAISWINREEGEFVLKDQSMIAKLWGKVKGRPRMDKIKLGRAMRYYYKKKLLVKVPKKKAVYRFVKFDQLKQQIVPETINDIQEIDFSEVNTLDFIDDTDTASLSSFNDEDDIDTPLEDLLFNNSNTDQVPDPELPNLFPMEINTFYNDFNNSNNSHGNIDYSCNAQGTCTCIKSENMPTTQQLSSPSNYNNIESSDKQYATSSTDNNYFTSLLVKSMLITDNLDIDATNVNEDSQQQLCKQIYTPVTESTYTNFVKSEPVGQSTPYYTNTDIDLTLNALKEFERMVILNSLVQI